MSLEKLMPRGVELRIEIADGERMSVRVREIAERLKIGDPGISVARETVELLRVSVVKEEEGEEKTSTTTTPDEGIEVRRPPAVQTEDEWMTEIEPIPTRNGQALLALFRSECRPIPLVGRIPVSVL